MSSERLNGKVKWFNQAKAFGVIETENEQNYFVHITSIKNRKSLKENEKVTFEVAQKNGKQCAINVERCGGGSPMAKKRRRNRRKKKNTESFKPNHNEPNMRVVATAVAEGETRTYEQVRKRKVNENDVLIVNGLFGEGIYDKLVAEMEACGVDPKDLWKLWHGDSHTIADDKLGWKKNCPTFDMVIKRIKGFFDMDVKATRFNLYKDSSDWKPLHHDAAAVKKDKAATQNFTVGCSFGLEREAIFEHAKHRTTVSLPLPDGSVYCFGKDVNVQWRHGIRQIPPEEHMDQGRVSVIAWGWSDQMAVPHQ
jgi:cold shock CspA family protein